jgi:hypothetical protein
VLIVYSRQKFYIFSLVNREARAIGRSFKFSGLTRGKDVWVRVRARNSVGAGAWSDPATIMVT